MQTISILSGGPYVLKSHGNGWAYTLEAHIEGDAPYSVWVQDDDATAFRAELDGMEAARPNDATRDILGEMWAMYYQGEA